MSELDFLVTGRCEIEVSASSKESYWIARIDRLGALSFFKNMKEVNVFPPTPLTKRILKAVDAIHYDAAYYLAKSWETKKPWDSEEGRNLWWSMKKKVEGS